MAKRRGRPSKAGERHKCGKLKQPKEPKPVDPTAKVITARRRFNTHYSWALGRFFAAGFMGDGNTAKDRWDGAQKFLRIYGAVYGGPYYRCPLDQTPRGGSGSDPFADHDRKEADREWIRTAMQSLDMSGCYPYLEQVISQAHVDAGPSWLDRMLDVQLWNKELATTNAQLKAQCAKAKREFVPLQPKFIDPRDQMIADAVNVALDILAPPAKAQRILVERWDDAA